MHDVTDGLIPTHVAGRQAFHRAAVNVLGTGGMIGPASMSLLIINRLATQTPKVLSDSKAPSGKSDSSLESSFLTLAAHIARKYQVRIINATSSYLHGLSMSSSSHLVDG